jgi:hypothetical protein
MRKTRTRTGGSGVLSRFVELMALAASFRTVRGVSLLRNAYGDAE